MVLPQAPILGRRQRDELPILEGEGLMSEPISDEILEANQPEYDLMIDNGEATLKVSVKGSQDGG